MKIPEEMLRALSAEAEKRRKEILARAKAEASKIIREAKKEEERIIEKARREATVSLPADRARVINEARLYLTREILRAKEKLVEKVFEEVRKRLGKLRESPQYPRILEYLINQVAAESAGNFTVSVNKADEKLARQILDKMGRKYVLKTDLNTAGGVKVQTSHGRVIITNTFESRFERAAEFLREEVAETLFGSS